MILSFQLEKGVSYHLGRKGSIFLVRLSWDGVVFRGRQPFFLRPLLSSPSLPSPLSPSPHYKRGSLLRHGGHVVVGRVPRRVA